MRTERPRTPVKHSVLFGAYYAVLVAFLLVSFFPQHRLWGINWWAYFPGYVPFVLFAVGALAPIVLQVVLRRGRSDVVDDRAPNGKGSRYFIIVSCLTVAYGFAFYFLRARTHFLGDGYAALASLASDNPLVKPRGLGEGLLHVWVKSAIRADGETAALASFQVISISAGILFLMTVAAFAALLFERARDRILLFLGLASSGYMLLFFGYVEYYSLFVLSVAVFSLTGLSVIRGQINRWLIFPVLGLAVFFHTMGLTLIPSVVYLMLANSRVGGFLSKLSRKTKLLIGTMAFVVVALPFYYYYSTDYFFRFAFVPLSENRFTVEGYTLFSFEHLVDVFNLLILLLPGLPLVVVVLFFLPVRRMLRQREYRYLLILLASTLGAVFILDPKLGVPRDWDLLAFSGVPLVILAYYLVLESRRFTKPRVTICVLSIFLGFLLLFPRVTSQVVPDISVAHCRNYFELDKMKSRTARLMLINFYRDAGDEDMARLETERAFADFPEKRMVDSAVVLINAGHPLEAVQLLRQVLQRIPTFADAWLNLGQCYIRLRDYDNATDYLRIADGLNPYNPQFLNDLGAAYLYMGDYQRAEKALKRSLSFDTTVFEPFFNLVQLYALQNDEDKYRQSFLKMISRSEASTEVLKGLGDSNLRRRDFRRAAEAYRVAVQRGLDSAYVNQLAQKHPQLLQHLLRQAGSPGSLDYDH